MGGALDRLPLIFEEIFMTTFPVLVLNSGSSSIKFSVYEASENQRQKMLEGEVEGIGAGENSGKFWIKSWLKDAGGESANGEKLIDETPALPDLSAAFTLVAKALNQAPFPRPAAIGHRMVCGGPAVTENQRITSTLIDEMERYTAFAPLHTPSEIYIMRQAMQLFPDAPNFLCLDSRFHRDLPEVTRRLPIPDEYSAMGLRRFGAHGLSYESIVAHLQTNIPAGLPSRLIVAHLGNGASICAIRDGQSVDTSMGLTPTGGLISGSRTGDIDPGVLLFVLRKLAETATNTSGAADRLEKIVNKQSGLLGVSQLTNDMRALREAIAEGNAAARLAVDEFVYVIRKFIGSYIGVLSGLDMLVFTGGIGENDSATRAEICVGMQALGIVLDSERNNARGGEVISADHSPVTVCVIPAAEDLMIVNHVCQLAGRN
jgi:acetate kinase